MQYSATMNSALFEFYRKYRANLIVLPPYSSELNPIEKYLVCIEEQDNYIAGGSQ